MYLQKCQDLTKSFSQAKLVLQIILIRVHQAILTSIIYFCIRKFSMLAPTLTKRSVQKCFFITSLHSLFYRCQTMQIAKTQNLKNLLKLSLNSAEYCYILWLIKQTLTVNFIVSCRFLNIMLDTELKIEWEFSQRCFKICKKEHLIEFTSRYSSSKLSHLI